MKRERTCFKSLLLYNAHFLELEIHGSRYKISSIFFWGGGGQKRAKQMQMGGTEKVLLQPFKILCTPLMYSIMVNLLYAGTPL